ncbi:MAG: ATPase, T2SS/T4P/T4SS family [Planctomycetota bacterium]
MTELRDWAERLGKRVYEDLGDFVPDAEFLRVVPISHARQHQIIGLRQRQQSDAAPDRPESSSDRLILAISRPESWNQRDVVSRMMNTPVRTVLATPDAIAGMIDAAYADRGGDAGGVLESIREVGDDQMMVISDREDLLDTDSRAPVIRLVSQMLFDAVVAGASDIHVQPYEDRLQVRQRLDGVLFDTLEIPKSMQEEVLTRIKVLGRMNIAEKRLPQDGRATVQLGSRIVDLRIASLPTSYNERIVIRLLDKSARAYTLDDLGMPDQTRRQWQDLIAVDHGLILVTGPTGSGKSTTLYGALQSLNSKQTNILTLEDPIEYQLDGISQTQINEKKGLTFASGMRSLLRQDPDVIMVGEIRDGETANMAIQASQTGHLVFSTLHTNDAASAVTRLLDLGVQPYLVASTLVASLAQRLVRTLCADCKELQPDGAAMPVGCEACRGSGFRGRKGLFELLIVDDAIRSHIQQRAGATEIRRTAMAAGMTLLADDGDRKIREGVTIRDEVMRVTNSAMVD